jgi:acetoin utilization protein AcuC
MKKNDFGFIYHKDYNKYDLGINHPLIGDKPKKIIDFFKEKSIMKEIKEFTPQIADEKELLRVHTEGYVERVKELSINGGLLSLDTPAPIGIFECASLATGGTILGGKKLFEGFNCMINPLAGFHHASRSFSSGFCFFNDIAIVIEYLREKYNLKRFQIVDLDVHHANGTQEIYYDDPSVLKISFHQDGRTLYPGTGAIEKIGRDAGEGFTVNLPLPPETGNESYFKAFKQIVPPLTKQFKPEIIIYQCGVDTHNSDPLADLCLTHQIYYEIANNMIKLSNETCNKLLVLLGGGYNSNASVLSYYNIMCGLLGKKEYIKEEEVLDKKISEVDELVKQLKQILTPYWKL